MERLETTAPEDSTNSDPRMPIKAASLAPICFKWAEALAPWISLQVQSLPDDKKGVFQSPPGCGLLGRPEVSTAVPRGSPQKLAVF